MVFRVLALRLGEAVDKTGHGYLREGGDSPLAMDSSLTLWVSTENSVCLHAGSRYISPYTNHAYSRG